MSKTNSPDILRPIDATVEVTNRNKTITTIDLYNECEVAPIGPRTKTHIALIGSTVIVNQHQDGRVIGTPINIDKSKIFGGFSVRRIK